MPLVSVIMPVYNGERYLAEAIESILAQTFTDFELIIVDDGSRDRSLEIIRDFEKRDERISVIQRETNRGEGDARNSGVAASNGQYIANMDCDVVSLPERLEKQVEYMQANPEIGLLGTRARIVDADLSPRSYFDVPPEHALIVIRLFVGGPLVHPAVMVRRNCLETADGYDPAFTCAADIALYGRLLWTAQVRFANLPACLLLYRVHGSNLSINGNRKRLELSYEARLRMLERLWNERPEATVHRFRRLALRRKLNWRERFLARRDMSRLIEALIAKNWVDKTDKHLLVGEMHHRLGWGGPRLWQMFCHWRRHHFGR